MQTPSHSRVLLAVFLIAVGLSLSGIQSQAFESNALCLAEKNASFVRKAAIIGADDRQTLSDYAKQHGLDPKKTEAVFAATGIINCDGREASAQLTGRNDVLTTVGHLFVADDCTRKRLRSCYFEIKIDGIEKEFPLALETLKTRACTMGRYFDFDIDWAVVKLSRPADGIWPYPVADQSSAINAGDDIIQVSGRNRNFRRSGNYPKTIQHCQLRGWGRPAFGAFDKVLRHDCDTGRGSSGSGQFIRGSRGVHLISINVGESGASGLRDGADYKDSGENFHYNLSVPLESDFLAALKSYIGE